MNALCSDDACLLMLGCRTRPVIPRRSCMQNRCKIVFGFARSMLGQFSCNVPTLIVPFLKACLRLNSALRSISIPVSTDGNVTASLSDNTESVSTACTQYSCLRPVVLHTASSTVYTHSSCLRYSSCLSTTVAHSFTHSFIHSLDFKVLGPGMTIEPVVCKCQAKYPSTFET